MKRLLIVFVFCFISYSAFADIKILQCKLQNSDFILNFDINIKNKSIFHKNSFDFETKEKYEVNKFLKIVEWNYPYIWVLRSHNQSLNKNLELFDLSTPLYLSQSIYYNNFPNSVVFQSGRGDCFWN